jgi:hypothetical protein
MQLLVGLLLQLMLQFLGFIMLTSLGEQKIVGMKKKWKVKWELNQSFQDTWLTMFVWAKPIVRLDGKMHMIQYKISSMIPWREKT